MIDDFKGGYMVIEYLIKLGYMCIGIIILDIFFYNVYECYEGYLVCMKDYKFIVKDIWIVSGD